MSSVYGNNIKISVFGQSHSEAIGVVIDGLPAGFEIDFGELSAFTERRTAGKEGTTARKEPDTPEILSGIFEGKTCGAPLCAVIKNTDVRSSDYDKLKNTPRPSHADYTALIKYGGFADYRGGGHFSGRLTAPIVFAGGICLQMLMQKGIRIRARVCSIGKMSDEDPGTADPAEIISRLEKSEFPCLGDPKPLMDEIKKAASELDSVGGVVECYVTGIPAGLGDPMFDGVESRLSSMLFSIPAVKGVEFGGGFALSHMRGSSANDQFKIAGGSVAASTNNSGGILGGITDGMALVFRAAFKPTPSIAKEQQTVDTATMSETALSIKGRHDPCIAVRAVPCVEAAAAIVIADMMKKEEIWTSKK